MATTSTKKLNIATYFENFTIKLQVFYVLNMHVKFHTNHILFTILSNANIGENSIS